MMNRRAITTFLAWTGVLVAAAIPFVLALAKWKAGWSDVRWLPSHGNEVIISPNKCELYLLYEGDPTNFPVWWTESWGQRTLLGNETVFLEIYGAIGVPVHARKLRIHIDTWWLILALAQPMLWRLAARQRRAREALIGCCANCGYDLRGSKGDCPECGCPPSEQHIPRRRPVFAVLAGMSFVIFIGLGVQVLSGQETGVGRFRAELSTTHFQYRYDNEEFTWIRKGSPTKETYINALGVSVSRWSMWQTAHRWELEISKPLLLSLTATLPVLWWMRAIRLRREERARWMKGVKQK
jgi:hypothetical protein